MDIMRDGPVLVLSGDLDVRSTMQVRTAVHELLGCLRRTSSIDLSGVETRRRDRAEGARRRDRQAVRDGHHLTLRGCLPPYAGCCTCPTSPASSRWSAGPVDAADVG